MSDRDKIAKIIREARINASPMAQLGYPEADALLDYGVIVPPCKVGDIVYVIEPCTCFNGYRTFEECHRRRTKATKWIKVIMTNKKHHNRCMKLFERTYKPEYIFKIGKTVFLTKEEAKTELEKRCNNA